MKVIKIKTNRNTGVEKFNDYSKKIHSISLTADLNRQKKNYWNWNYTETERQNNEVK